MEHAETLSQCLAKQINYRHAFVIDNQFGEASDEELNNISAQERDQLSNGVNEQAARGVGFWYERHAVNAKNKGLTGDLFDWLNSDVLLHAIAQITGATDYGGASAQATRFQAGDFLTRHKDDITAEKRKIAYVINLSPRWHPDWGGLLQFYEMNGTPRNAWMPDFNSLSLFDVSHVHSVTSISSFAPEPRLAISGWFHSH